jgi:hypothetical protein
MAGRVWRANSGCKDYCIRERFAVTGSLAIVPIVRVLFMTMLFVGQCDRRRREPMGLMARRLLIVAGFAVLAVANFFTATLEAEESDSAAPEALLKPWADATARFQKSRESASEGLIRLLDGAEEKARAAGDLEKVKFIKQERAQFLQDQTLPKSVKTATYEKALDAAKASLRAAAQKTKMALVRQKFDEDAATIDQELGELVGPARVELVKGKPGGSGPPDGRIYWVEKKRETSSAGSSRWSGLRRLTTDLTSVTRLRRSPGLPSMLSCTTNSAMSECGCSGKRRSKLRTIMNLRQIHLATGLRVRGLLSQVTFCTCLIFKKRG